MEVDTKTTGKRSTVSVVASIDESASLYGMDGQQADGYRSSYEAQYQMAQVCVCVCSSQFMLLSSRRETHGLLGNMINVMPHFCS